MKHIRILVYTFITIASISGMDTQARVQKGTNIVKILRIDLDKKNVPEYQAKFDAFVERRRGEATTVSRLLKVPFGLGKMAGSFWSGVDLEEADAFLKRVFEDEAALKKAAQKLDSDEESIAYLRTLLGDMKPNDIRKKNSKPMAAPMKKHKHPALTKNGTGEAKEKDIKPWDKDAVDDDTFYRIAACSFMAYVIVEEDGSAKQEDEGIA